MICRKCEWHDAAKDEEICLMCDAIERNEARKVADRIMALAENLIISAIVAACFVLLVLLMWGAS